MLKGRGLQGNRSAFSYQVPSEYVQKKCKGAVPLPTQTNISGILRHELYLNSLTFELLIKC